MPSLENIKRFLAIVVLVCFALPLSHCTYKQKMPADAAHAAATQETAEDDDFVMVRALSFHAADEILPMCAFVWPLVFWAVRAKTRSRLAAGLVSVLEVAACTASAGYFYLIIRTWGQIRYGGVLLLGSDMVYLLAAAITFIFSLRKPASS